MYFIFSPKTTPPLSGQLKMYFILFRNKVHSEIKYILKFLYFML